MISATAGQEKHRPVIEADRAPPGELTEERLVIREINPRMNRAMPRNFAETVSTVAARHLASAPI
jgi:hypothetical protein